MQNDKLTELISRHLSGEASEEELAQLHAHLANHPQDQYFFDILSNYWQSHNNDNNPNDTTASGNHFNQLMEKALREDEETPIVVQRPLVHLMKRRWWQYAAAAVLIIGPAYWLWSGSSKTATATTSPKKNEITANKGARSKLRLPDGTTVWLNSDSKLTYNDHFNGSVREVELTGEGFFDVVKDPRHPFIVHTSGIDIRVLGTAFNVKSYPQSNTIEATLIRGLIEVARKDSPDGPKVYLHPHEKLVYRKEDSTFTATTDKSHVTANATETNMAISSVPHNLPDSTLPETAWVYNKLMFNGESFQEMADKMERWFNVKMVLEDEKVANYRFRVIFENETIEQALQALQLTASFNYKINQDHEVHIYKTR
ncbi:FecR family protein [Hydrobacter penzbergensis]|uniref:FecR family protein n=1 Tax=Hydrobacter penzbergensis TaxID=1235997 RepID=A0A8X8LEK1_9BACT|nr:FecR domain-containing protein [Hydrobacter penzbergensis]SDW64228.1 FecR family protein [Hydrobacter penzbergensis]